MTLAEQKRREVRTAFVERIPLAIASRPVPADSKLGRVHEQLLGLGDHWAPLSPFPLGERALTRVHDRSYVQALFDARPPDQRPNTTPTADEIGSCHAAALAALTHGIGGALTGGAHDAFWDSPGRNCPFNGLLASAVTLLDEHRVERVAIIDGSPQYGSGTQSIIDRLGLGSQILHISFGKRFQFRRQAQVYLARARLLEAELGVFNPGLIYYQAAAGSHVLGPVGGVLGTDQMRRRDRSVFCAARSLGTPIAWNIDGERPPAPPVDVAVEVHLNTFREAWRAFSADPIA